MRHLNLRRVCSLIAVLLTIGTLASCASDGGMESSPSASASIAGSASPTGTPITTESYEEQRTNSQIGIWYSVWYDLNAENSFWDTSGRKSSTYAGDPIYYRPLLPDGTYGKYDSGDSQVIQFHLQQIAEAQIDFIIMDQTNMIDAAPGNLNANALKMAKAIKQWNDTEGNRDIKYCSGIGALATKESYDIIESEAKKLWNRYVDTPRGTEDYHMYVDGKPLLVIFNDYFKEADWNAYDGDKTYASKFTIRFSHGHVYEGEYGQWGWVMPDGPQIDEDVAVMMPGWYKIGFTLPFVYRNRGASYENGWKELLASEIVPDFVVINSFNEYAEHTAVFTASTSGFPEDYGIEKWLDEDGEENPSLYWDMTKTYIAKYKNGDRK